MTSATCTRFRYSPDMPRSPPEAIRRRRQVDVRDFGLHDPLRLVDRSQGIEPCVGHLGHADVGLGASAVSSDLRRAACHRVEYSALAASGQSDYRDVHSPCSSPPRARVSQVSEGRVGPTGQQRERHHRVYTAAPHPRATLSAIEPRLAAYELGQGAQGQQQRPQGRETQPAGNASG